MGCTGYKGMMLLNIISVIAAFITGLVGFISLIDKDSRWYGALFIGITSGLILLMIFVTFPYMDDLAKECENDKKLTGITS